MLRRSSSSLRLLSPLFFGLAGGLAPSGTPGAQVGTVRSEQKISATSGGFHGLLQWYDFFGSSVASIGDLDGDGSTELAVGASGDGNLNEGAVWILFLDPGGRVKTDQKIKSQRRGRFGGDLDPGDVFGASVASLGDLDRDGHPDLAVGAPGDDEGGFGQGAVWILFLNADGTVKSEQKICETSGGFGGSLKSGGFGYALTALGDLDGDGHTELAVGAPDEAIWILFLNADGTVRSEHEVIGTPGGVRSLARLGDLDEDGNPDLVVGVPYDSDTDDPRDRIRRRFGQSPYRPAAQRRGAVWILFLNADGTVRARQKIGGSRGRFGGELEDLDNFGTSLAPVGDVDGDGHPDLAVGALGDDDGGFDRGAVWLLFLNVDGTVKSEQKISGITGGFAGSLDDVDFFGCSVASPGDIDGDGYVDLVVGALNDDDGCCNKGAVWILFLLGDTPPALECPPVVALDAKGDSPGEFVSFSVTARDDRDPAPSVVCVPSSGSFFPRGTTIVTCTATDASGNRSTCTFPVVVLPSARSR